MSRPRVDKSLEWNFIKMILTKDQERSKGDKEWIWIWKSGYVKLDKTHCYTGKFNMALSLCRVLEVALYFSESFSEAVAEASWPLRVTVVCFLGQESNFRSPIPQ